MVTNVAYRCVEFLGPLTIPNSRDYFTNTFSSDLQNCVTALKCEFEGSFPQYMKLCSQVKIQSHYIFDAVSATDVHKQEQYTLEHRFIAVWCIYAFYSQTVRILRSGNEVPFSGTSTISSERTVSALTQLLERCGLFTLLQH